MFDVFSMIIHSKDDYSRFFEALDLFDLEYRATVLKTQFHLSIQKI